MTIPPPPEAAMAGGGLYERFAGLFPEARSSRIVNAIFADLFHAYAEPRRAYHTLRHVEACLLTIDATPIGRSNTGGAANHNARDAEIAIWWHDAIYVPGDTANEERSAAWLECVSRALGVWHPERILGAILATRHTLEPTPDPLAAYVVDVDLSILGSEPATYDAYVRQIRREYSHVPDEAYRAGRAAFMRKFLARPNLYNREEFRERFEHPARENILREITSLETGGAK